MSEQSQTSYYCLAFYYRDDSNPFQHVYVFTSLKKLCKLIKTFMNSSFGETDNEDERKKLFLYVQLIKKKDDVSKKHDYFI